ncbi:MAG: hypothetical protein SFZ23_01655 [Planctomycetota bacterium]|nr:hypothetical protein [Planctomycetota bacterium]
MRRATALVAMVAVLIVLSLMTTAAVLAGGRAASQGALRVDGHRALMGVTAAGHMAIKEVMDGADLDADGGIGSISGDGNSNNDPLLAGDTRISAQRTDIGGQIVLSLEARSGSAVRRASLTMSPGGGSGGSGTGSDVFFSTSSSNWLRRATFSTSSMTWSAAANLASFATTPIWVAAAQGSTTTHLLASNSGNGLAYGRRASDGTVSAFSTVSTDIASTNSRPFDVAVEPSSGDALMVYWEATANALRFRTFTGSTLSSASAMSLSTNTVKWVRLIPLDSTGDEIMAITIDTSKHARAARWTGSAWTGATALSTTLAEEVREGVSAAHEPVSGRLMVVMHDSNNGMFRYRTWSSGAGSAASTRSGFGSVKLHWMRVVGVPGSNRMFLAASDENQGLWTSQWDGSTWSTPVQTLSGFQSANARRFDIGVSADGTRAALFYASSNSMRYRLWNGTAWGSEVTAFSPSGQPEVIVARPGPVVGSIIGALGDHGGVNAWYFAGSTFTRSRVGTTSTSYSETEWFAVPVGAGSSTRPRVLGWISTIP